MCAFKTNLYSKKKVSLGEGGSLKQGVCKHMNFLHINMFYTIIYGANDNIKKASGRVSDNKGIYILEF